MASPPSHPETESPFLIRQKRLAEAMQALGIDAIAFNPGPSLTYLTGLSFHLSERPVVALLSPRAPLLLVLPELEAGKAEDRPYPLQVFTYGEDPTAWQQVFHRAAQAAGLNGSTVGLEPQRLRVLELRLLEAAIPKTQFVSAEKAIAALRMHKDESAAAAMQKAVQIAESALLHTLPFVKVGVTERDLVGELSLQLLRAGSDPEFPISPGVFGGPNSANPHASPSDRSLSPGDLLVFDWGANYQGYYSDITRTFAIGKVEPEFEKIHAIVLQANTAARAAVRPGASAGAVDHAARSVIESTGYGAYFTHRTGHGLGLEIHEEPYMRAGSDLLLEPGMTFTIEPGIYLPGRNGVRIEDNVLVTADGARILTSLPRELKNLLSP